MGSFFKSPILESLLLSNYEIMTFNMILNPVSNFLWQTLSNTYVFVAVAKIIFISIGVGGHDAAHNIDRY